MWLSSLSPTTRGIKAGLGDLVWLHCCRGKISYRTKPDSEGRLVKVHHKILLSLLETWLSQPDNKRQIYKPSACWHLSNLELSSLDWLPDALLVWGILSGPMKNNEGAGRKALVPCPLTTWAVSILGSGYSAHMSPCCILKSHLFPGPSTNCLCSSIELDLFLDLAKKQ